MSASVALGRCRYGRTAVWVPRGDLGGSDARRLAARVGHHFRGDGSPLLLDLRALERIDSCALAALETCRTEHAGFGLVGRPRAWSALPLNLRLGIDGLEGSPDLATALAESERTAVSAPPFELRRHARFPVGIPVEVLFGETSSPATLADLSRGGLRLERLAAPFVAAVAAAGSARLEVLGLDDEPLARDLLGMAAAGPVPAVPVHLLCADGIGVRFAEARPPL